MSAFDPKRTCLGVSRLRSYVSRLLHTLKFIGILPPALCARIAPAGILFCVLVAGGNVRCVVPRRFPADGAFFVCFPPTLRHSVLFLMLIAYCRVSVHSCRRRGSSSLLRTCPHHGWSGSSMKMSRGRPLAISLGPT